MENKSSKNGLLKGFLRNRNTFTAWVFIILFLTSSVLIPQLDLRKTNIHADEPGWIASGYIHTELLINLISGKHFDLAQWRARDSYFAMNGQAGKWLLGIPVWIYFHTIEPQNIITPPNLTVASFSALSHSLWADLHAGKESAKHVVILARGISAFFGVLCSLLVFSICYICGGVLLGIVAVILLLTNNLFVSYATRAMTDIYYLFFLLCSCFLVTFFIKNQRRNQTLSLRRSISWGIFSGLAACVKVTGILVGGFYFFIYAVFEKFFLKLSKLWLHLTVFIFSTLLIIYATNPALWIPLSSIKPRLVLSEAKSVGKEVAAKLSGKDVPIELSKYPQLTNLFSFPLVFLEWKYIMKEQQENISKGVWKLNQQKFGMTIEDQVLKRGASSFVRINKLLFLFLSRFPIVSLMFLAAGLMFCFLEIKKAVRQKHTSVYAGPFFFFLANYIFILVTLKLNWDRYFLTTVTAAQILLAIGVVNSGRRIYSLTKYRNGGQSR